MSASSSSGRLKGDRSIIILHDISQRAWKVYLILSKASPLLKSTCTQLLSIIGNLHQIEDYREKGEISVENKKTLNEISDWLNGLFADLEASIVDLKGGPSEEGFEAIAGNELDPTGQLDAFVELIRRDRQYKLWNALEEIHGSDPTESQPSILPESTFLELQMLGFSKDVLQEEYFFVNDWFRSRIEDMEEAVANPQEEDDLPGYTPGAKKHPIEEKIHQMSDATREIGLIEQEEHVTSSKVEPPPYTFDEGTDMMYDAEFSILIQQAIETEASLRIIQREQRPESVPQPYHWLPRQMQKQYKDSKEICPIAEDSFTIMAYDTAPRCSEIIQQITCLLRVSFERLPSESVWPLIEEAFRSLKVMSIAMTKFTQLENQDSYTNKFSDMDRLEFEFTTAVAMDEGLIVPHREFDLAKKSYYRLLTYTMGLLTAMTIVFPGRTHVTRTKETVEFVWKENKMDARVAWLEKQLAAWTKVEQAVSFCRDWRRLRPGLRQQAFDALKEWETAKQILSGSTNNNIIEITVIAAASLPKSRFTIPTALAKVIYYGPNRFGGALRMSEQITSPSQKTCNPVWGKNFSFNVVPHSKFIDIEIYDSGFIDKQLCKARLPFSMIPGVEANFLDRSLMYGLDEEVEVPLAIIDGKGKEREPPILRLHLKWTGRVPKVEELGLPTRPPGRMFRADIVGIPLSAEERNSLERGVAPGVIRREDVMREPEGPMLL